MSRLNSFYLTPQAWQAPFVLQGEEAHHLGRVLRARPGQQVRLFDGQGREGLFEIKNCTKSQILLQLEQEKRHEPPAKKIYLALGWNKSLRRSWLLEKCVELGVSGIYFWQAQYSQGKVPDQIKTAWQAQIISAAKQSLNPWLPEINICTKGATQLLEQTKHITNKILLWEKENSENILSMNHLKSNSSLFILGPEGGLAKEEADFLINQGAGPVSLGSRILRWETAALVCLGLGFLQK